MEALPEISPDTLQHLMKTEESLCIIDVRKRPAFEESGRIITGAVWRPFDQMDDWAGDLPKDSTIIIYCVHGHEVSQGVCATLNQCSISASFLTGGFEDFVAAGGSTIEVPDAT